MAFLRMPTYSIIIPVYNEEKSLKTLYAEIEEAMAALEGEFETIFVDDGSSDSSREVIQEMLASRPGRLRLIPLEQHRGQTHALAAGLEAGTGDIVVTLDADLQNDPRDIPRLVKKMDEGADVVCGWRRSRQDKFLKTALSRAGNFVQRSLTGLAIHDVACTLRAYKRHCIPAIALKTEGEHRFIPLSLFLQGYKIAEVVSHHRPRKYGQGKYRHKRIFKVIVDFLKLITVQERWKNNPSP